MAKRSTAEIFFRIAVSKVESASIREWATSAHNRPLFLDDVQGYLDRTGKGACHVKYATKIAALAIGLW